LILNTEFYATGGLFSPADNRGLHDAMMAALYRIDIIFKTSSIQIIRYINCLKLNKT